jgi:hypothetical protein
MKPYYHFRFNAQICRQCIIYRRISTIITDRAQCIKIHAGIFTPKTKQIHIQPFRLTTTQMIFFHLQTYSALCFTSRRYWPLKSYHTSVCICLSHSHSSLSYFAQQDIKGCSSALFSLADLSCSQFHKQSLLATHTLSRFSVYLSLPLSLISLQLC